ncbi:hypothetical protein NLG97_g9166 [Lecanicillium saksenae]|uniref:Uncharacterized protein n=1 Tax=Lecanicillium saksenae TaxID=468837 RepID=A0ACC1QIM8_9HYPO|nr:hypothetical protein NLG97_g9166 [Lecanicillium saksenae]
MPSLFRRRDERAESNALLAKNVSSVLRNRIIPLTNMSKLHRLSPERLRTEWNIVVQDLDLRTGQPPRGHAFIQPIPMETVSDWLQEFRPWEQQDGLTGCGDFDLIGTYNPQRDYRRGMSQSFGIRRMVNNYITSCYREEKGSMIQNRTAWRESLIPMGRLQHRGEPDRNWGISLMLHQSDPRDAGKPYILNTRQNERVPHFACFLHDDVLLVDDKSLSSAELCTIFILALHISCLRMYEHVVVIPITVYSCSGWQVRIVQGCIDFRNLQFDIRCSKILDFNTGGVRDTEENLQRFMTLLGWVLGKPVGDVEQPQYSTRRR